MAGKVYEYPYLIHLHETNAVGGVVYFSNYVKWQGIVREDFFIKSVPEYRQIMMDVVSGKVNMITVEEHSRFISHALFGDEILIRLHTEDIQKCSFKFFFRMTKKNENGEIYEGWQTVSFDDYRGRFIPIPVPFLRVVLDYAPPKELDLYKTRYPLSAKIE
ncbi:MAG: hypothetical protein AUJ71_03855 [Candidatus Omnitrophica bacterium CG1_02_49_16]|nr:MAG: hypothetical protein AUJ71_03855 [Candidatus Omnitrophica bacterium CG1_02_49_16]